MSDRVLVVEDDPKLGAQVVASLAKEGLDVTWVQDGDEAAKLDPSAFDLVVLDLMLPGTYGLDVLKRFRAKSDVPVAREDAPGSPLPVCQRWPYQGRPTISLDFRVSDIDAR